MALAPKMQVKQGQSLVMTPQLQQAIKLLQLSNIELAAFVEEQLESNPLLERGTGTENRRGEDGAEGVSKDADPAEMSFESAGAGAAISEMDAPDNAAAEQGSVADMDPTAPSVGGEIDWSKARSGGSFNGSGDYDAAANTAKEISLPEHLSEQLLMTNVDPVSRLIGAHLIDHVDENGYLHIDEAEIADRLGASPARVSSMITLMQTFEPTGVMARSLSECLEIQLREKGELDTPMQALLDNLPLLAKHDMGRLAKICGVKADGLLDLVARLKALAPKPGLAYGGDMAAAIEPDVFIRSRPDGGWSVELNNDTLPHVLINSRYYAEVMNLSDDDSVKTFMSECQSNASWLVKSLDQRARTILKVASEIVKQQDGFFAYGVDHLRPLNLKTVADAIEMHESTVSRVTSNKFMATPRGLFELKYFFTASIGSMDGGESYSAEAVRHKIKILISEENGVKTVLSDDKLVKLLQAQGVDIARRTVAKYRESLGIPSSVERRRKFRHAV